MLAEFTDIKTLFMPSLVTNTSPGVTSKVYKNTQGLARDLSPDAADAKTGADDFIFGNAAAWFGDCELSVAKLCLSRLAHQSFNKDSGTIACSGGGSITANNRASTTDPAWYVFDSSTITAAPGWTTTGANYLGRPWGIDSRVIFQKCSLSNVVNPAGWTTLAAGATP